MQIYTEVIAFIVLFACMSPCGSWMEAVGSRGRSAVSADGWHRTDGRTDRMDGNIMLRRATDCDRIWAARARRLAPPTVRSVPQHQSQFHRHHRQPLSSRRPRPSRHPERRGARQREIGKYEQARRTRVVIHRSVGWGGFGYRQLSLKLRRRYGNTK